MPRRRYSESRATAEQTYRRFGRLVPSYATEQFDLPPRPRDNSYANYPPPGYDPTVPLERLRPAPQNSMRAKPQWRPQPNSRDNNWRYGQPTYSTPPWAVNRDWNSASPGFAGPTTFGNPFGSPYGGLSAPYGFPFALGIPPGVTW